MEPDKDAADNIVEVHLDIQVLTMSMLTKLISLALRSPHTLPRKSQFLRPVAICFHQRFDSVIVYRQAAIEREFLQRLPVVAQVLEYLYQLALG